MYSKKIKFKKFRKGRLKKFEFKMNKLKFGVLGLKAIESGIIKYHQILSVKHLILKEMKKKSKIWIRVSPNLSVTSKSIGMRMGKGKGLVSQWVVKINSGAVLFEVCSAKLNYIMLALKMSKSKLPIKTKIFW